MADTIWWTRPNITVMCKWGVFLFYPGFLVILRRLWFPCLFPHPSCLSLNVPDQQTVKFNRKLQIVTCKKTRIRCDRASFSHRRMMHRHALLRIPCVNLRYHLIHRVHAQDWTVFFRCSYQTATSCISVGGTVLSHLAVRAIRPVHHRLAEMARGGVCSLLFTNVPHLVVAALVLFMHKV